MPPIRGWVAWQPCDPHVLAPQARRVGAERAKQVVPYECEEPEVDVAFGFRGDVVTAMARSHGPQPAKDAHPHVDVGVLQEQLDRGDKPKAARRPTAPAPVLLAALLRRPSRRA